MLLALPGPHVHQSPVTAAARPPMLSHPPMGPSRPMPGSFLSRHPLLCRDGDPEAGTRPVVSGSAESEVTQVSGVHLAWDSSKCLTERHGCGCP